MTNAKIKFIKIKTKDDHIAANRIDGQRIDILAILIGFLIGNIITWLSSRKNSEYN